MLEPGSIRIDEAIAVATVRTAWAQVDYLRTSAWTRDAVVTARRVERLADDLALLAATASAQARAAKGVRHGIGGAADLFGRGVGLIERSRQLRAASQRARRATLDAMRGRAPAAPRMPGP